MAYHGDVFVVNAIAQTHEARSQIYSGAPCSTYAKEVQRNEITNAQLARFNYSKIKAPPVSAVGGRYDGEANSEPYLRFRHTAHGFEQSQYRGQTHLVFIYSTPGLSIIKL